MGRRLLLRSNSYRGGRRRKCNPTFDIGNMRNPRANGGLKRAILRNVLSSHNEINKILA